MSSREHRCTDPTCGWQDFNHDYMLWCPICGGGISSVWDREDERPCDKDEPDDCDCSDCDEDNCDWRDER